MPNCAHDPPIHVSRARQRSGLRPRALTEAEHVQAVAAGDERVCRAARRVQEAVARADTVIVPAARPSRRHVPRNSPTSVMTPSTSSQWVTIRRRC